MSKCKAFTALDQYPSGQMTFCILANIENTNLVDLTERWNPSKSRGCGNPREQFLHRVDGGINLLCDSALMGEGKKKKNGCRSHSSRDASRAE